MPSDKTDQVTADPIYEQLRASITSGELAPGEPLRQDEIARAHGVSKIPVREALLRLELEGLVLFRKNKGATVRELTIHEVLNLLDIRETLECKALELAIPNMVNGDFEAARTVLEEYSHETELAAWSALNLRFHKILYEPCDNALLLQMIEDVRVRMGPVLRLAVTEASGLDRPHAEHCAILDACEAGKVQDAVRLLGRHIETTRKETAARLRRRS